MTFQVRAQSLPCDALTGGQFAEERKDFLSVVILLALLLLGQLYLVYFKSFNWDEFFHFGYVHIAREGMLTTPFQSLQFRILSWVPDVAEDLFDQMRLARFFIWGCTLVTLAAIFGVACQFTSRINASFAAVAYLSAGYVFTQSFSIRADGMAAATLMSALYVFASGPLTLKRAVLAGALVGLAGMITAKSVFYAPCFAALAWWRFKQCGSEQRVVLHFVAFTLSALTSFILIMVQHKAGLAETADSAFQSGGLIQEAGRWFFSATKYAAFHVLEQAFWGIVFLVCLGLAPWAWHRFVGEPSARIALLGFAAPILSLLIYRNTYPYYFVFLLAPVAVAVAPSFGLLRHRYGGVRTLALMAVAPIVMTVVEPRDVQYRQEALIDYVHQEFPKPVPYLAFTNVVADYPRILTHMAGGPGIEHYFNRGRATVAENVRADEVAFVIADRWQVLAALRGTPMGPTFLPEDGELLSSNFVQQWGPLYRAGKDIPAGDDSARIRVLHPGPYTLEGGPVVVDGRSVKPGDTIMLSTGMHSIAGPRQERAVLWRGERLPAPPSFEWAGELYTDY